MKYLYVFLFRKSILVDILLAFGGRPVPPNMLHSHKTVCKLMKWAERERLYS